MRKAYEFPANFLIGRLSLMVDALEITFKMNSLQNIEWVAWEILELMPYGTPGRYLSYDEMYVFTMTMFIAAQAVLNIEEMNVERGSIREVEIHLRLLEYAIGNRQQQFSRNVQHFKDIIFAPVVEKFLQKKWQTFLRIAGLFFQMQKHKETYRLLCEIENEIRQYSMTIAVEKWWPIFIDVIFMYDALQDYTKVQELLFNVNYSKK